MMDTSADELYLLQKHPLFKGIDAGGLNQLSNCFSFRFANFYKDEYLVLEGDPVTCVGLILSGTVLMEKSDLQGNNFFLTEIRKNELFGDAFIGSNIQSSTVNYRAMTDCHVLLFQYRDPRTFCRRNCRCHLVFSENLMYLLALKARTFLAKVEILSTRSLRGRILRFLHIVEEYPDIIGLRGDRRQEKKLKKNQVFVPLTHTELAEYLGVNRSALVRELGRMKQENLLTWDKHVYTLISPETPETL